MAVKHVWEELEKVQERVHDSSAETLTEVDFDSRQFDEADR